MPSKGAVAMASVIVMAVRRRGHRCSPDLVTERTGKCSSPVIGFRSSVEWWRRGWGQATAGAEASGDDSVRWWKKKREGRKRVEEEEKKERKGEKGKKRKGKE